MLSSLVAHADPVIEWNDKAGGWIAESKIGTPPAIRIMALVQTAVHDAVVATRTQADAARAPDNAVPAAVAAANRMTLTRLLPGQQAGIEAAYQAALARIADGPAKAAGILAGEDAAKAVLARGASDGVQTPESYRPQVVAGRYAPTVLPAALSWPARKPWLLDSVDQFRPAPPPALDSAQWVRDFNEVRELGGKHSARRTAEQTAIARFWEFSLPAIYMGVVRSVAAAPGREVTRNARLYAAVAQAMDDAMVAVFDAKYHYQFWRPVTAIRNGDQDGNDKTPRDPAWMPYIDTPMHPEYPSAHAILAATVGTLVRIEAGRNALPVLRTSSPTAQGAVREWTDMESFMNEVAEARVLEGVHYRTSSEVGLQMGRKVGTLAARKWLGEDALAHSGSPLSAR